MDPKIGPLSFREDQYFVTVKAFVDVGDYSRLASHNRAFATTAVWSVTERPCVKSQSSATWKASFAKQRNGLYDTRRPLWVRVKNPDYTQAMGRVELFEERDR